MVFHNKLHLSGYSFAETCTAVCKDAELDIIF